MKNSHHPTLILIGVLIFIVVVLQFTYTTDQPQEVLDFPIKNQQLRQRQVRRDSLTFGYLYELRMFVQEWAFDQDSPCRVNIFSESHCLVALSTKIISSSIILLVLLMKLPQIYNLLKNKSVKGLSYTSQIMHIQKMIFLLGYNIRRKSALILYAEMYVHITQDSLIIVLFFFYEAYTNGKMKLQALSVATLFITMAWLNDYVPAAIFGASAIINQVFNIVSRCPQIELNHRNRATGQLSLMSYAISLFLTAARVFTLVVQESVDVIRVMDSAVVMFLETIIFAQIIIYWGKEINHDKKVRFKV